MSLSTARQPNHAPFSLIIILSFPWAMTIDGADPPPAVQVAPPPPTIVVLPQPSASTPPVFGISESITAWGDFLRADGERYRDYAEGDLLIAEAQTQWEEAISRRLDNLRKYTETYYDRRLIRERKLMDIMDAREDHRRLQSDQQQYARQRVVRRLMNDRNPSEIASGAGLNRTLGEFARTPLSSGISPGDSIAAQINERLQIAPDLYDDVRVTVGSGARFAISLGQPVPLDDYWWPDQLYIPSYSWERAKIVELLQTARSISQGGDRVSPELADGLSDTVMGLAERFRADNPEQLRQRFDQDARQRYLVADQFLTRMLHQTRSLRDSGRYDSLGVSTSQFSPHREGRDAYSLVDWMLSNGVQFAPAPPGRQASYLRLFNHLTQLLVMVQPDKYDLQKLEMSSPSLLTP